ncbi:MAG: TrkA C-terminal domain-containing protein [Clostridia bacterium]|nr:TrkA C-terminal domain-containing protein [Clostridia bacterium]
MNIYVAASLFALLIVLYWVISELFTILFRFVGLPEEKARFQVTSLLTGCGFTTRESEMILSTRQRRRLARITMLFGYVFNISVVSAFINVFVSLKLTQIGGYFAGVLIPLAGVAVVIILFRIKSVRAFADSMLEKLAGKIMHSDAVNTIMLIDHIGKGSIAQVSLKEVPEAYVDVPLSQTGLKEKENVLVMLVERKDLSIEAPTAHTVFNPGDKLTVFGDYKVVSQVFNAKERFE